MANLKEIRNRIASVSSTKQITAAMKMVAASKLRKAQNVITKLAPYADKLSEILALLSDTIRENELSLLTKVRPVEKLLVVSICSNKGLCGGFNSYVIKKTLAYYKEQTTNNPKLEVSFFAIGKKISEALHKQGLNVIKTDVTSGETYRFEDAMQIAEELKGYFLNKEYDKVVIISNKFINPAVQETVCLDFLPLSFDLGDKKYNSDYIFEPSKEEIVDTLLPMYLRTMVYRALVDSSAGEHGARMTAMNKATDNATELIKDLNLMYNKARQASITNEIIEIVSGANSI